MNEIIPMLEQFRAVLAQSPTMDAWTKTLPMLGVLLLGGVVVSVFGAKLAKFGVAAACGLVGASLGAALAQENGIAAPPCAVVAGAMLAVVGFLTFRLWVGVIAAGVAALVAVAVFGQGRLDTHVAAFQQREAARGQHTYVAVPESATTSASLHALDVVPAALPDVEPSIRRFWSYLQEQDATLATQTKGVAGAALVAGLFLGVLLSRLMLIASMSVIGTTLIVLAALGVMSSVSPSLVSSFHANPTVAAVGVGGLLVTSLIIQTLLTRGGRHAAPSGNSKS